MIILSIFSATILSYAAELPAERRLPLEQQITLLKLNIQTNNEELNKIRQELMSMKIFIMRMHENGAIEVSCGPIAQATSITITDEYEVDVKIASCLSNLRPLEQWKTIELVTDYLQTYTTLLKQQKKLKTLEKELSRYKKLPHENRIS